MISENKSRNPFLAFLFAAIIPGFGQVYNGQIKKGIIFLLLTLLLPFLWGFTRLGVFFLGFFLIIALDICFRIYIIYDAVKNARKLKSFTPKSYNTWYHYLVIFISVNSVLWFYDYNSILGVKSYKIPTNSNEPTLKVGDKIVADLNAFDSRKPNYGDIVIFQEKDSANPWIYRIVGLPNDKLEIQSNTLIINNKTCKTSFVRETKTGLFNVNEYEEELPNGHVHRIYTLIKPLDTLQNNFSVINIPPNNYYLMGDNRDNAMDSRYIGVVSGNQIKGKVLFGYWGKTTDRINVDFKKR